MSTPTNCGQAGQQLVDLFSCFAQNMGAQTAAHVNNKINEMVNIHDVDIDALHAQIQLIMGELAENEVVDGEQSTALANILNAITALQTSVANNSTSITQVQDALTAAVAALESSIQAEAAFNASEIARIEALITPHYDDAEVRALIQANVEAIGSEAVTRESEIARVEALIVANSGEINLLKESLAANAAAISALTSRVSTLETTVAANAAAANARMDSIDACLSGFFGALDAASCDTISNAFAAGLAGGNSGNAGAL